MGSAASCGVLFSSSGVKGKGQKWLGQGVWQARCSGSTVQPRKPWDGDNFLLSEDGPKLLRSRVRKIAVNSLDNVEYFDYMSCNKLPCRFQNTFLQTSPSDLLWKKMYGLFVLVMCTIGASAFRLQQVENTGKCLSFFLLFPSPFFLIFLSDSNVKISLIYIENCPDHTVFFKHYYELHGEPVVLKCPSPRYKHLDFSALTSNITWHKNGSNTMISGRDEDLRIWAKENALWFLPVRLEDSGVYICTKR